MKNAKDLKDNPDFEQEYYSRTPRSVYKVGYDSIRLTKWISYYDRPIYEKINYYDLMVSILSCLNETS